MPPVEFGRAIPSFKDTRVNLRKGPAKNGPLTYISTSRKYDSKRNKKKSESFI